MIDPVSHTGSRGGSMKVHELSKLTGINAETIRSYRNKGLLHPKKLSNGYYDYDLDDYISLIYVRKYRGYSIGLDDISSFYTSRNTDEIINVIDREQRILSERIARLEEEKRYLELERIHLLESTYTEKTNVQVMQSLDEKIDVYEYQKVFEDLAFQQQTYHMMTPSVRISKEILNGEIEDRIIPIQVGLGTYRYVIEEKGLQLPENHISIPHGLHVGQMISLTDLSSVNILQLKPMMSYAKEKGMPFLSDTTGYLMHIEKKDSAFIYHFRIRACIEVNQKVTSRP